MCTAVDDLQRPTLPREMGVPCCEKVMMIVILSDTIYLDCMRVFRSEVVYLDRI